MHIQKRLFTPIQIGPITLKHRVVMPPMSRLRAQWPSGIPSDLQLEYYRQRASDGGLIFTEATAISTSGRGYKGAPGLYSDEQVTGWKRITDAVHARGGYTFTQLWHAGRTTHIGVTQGKTFYGFSRDFLCKLFAINCFQLEDPGTVFDLILVV